LLQSNEKLQKFFLFLKNEKKKKTENYCPISNLCSITKVFKKYLLHRFQNIQEKEKTDLTGSCQHNFKNRNSLP
jgi:hypothetical protein